ncbi:MAG TPA: hypothetical protein VF894_09325 [Anaeromyxobacter sp.]
MRKAFDANVPKLKPRLKAGAPSAAAIDEVDEAPTAVSPIRTATATATPTPTPTSIATRAYSVRPERSGAATERDVATERSVAANVRPERSVAATERSVAATVRPERSGAAGDAKSKDAATPTAAQVQVQVQDQDQDQDQVPVPVPDVLARKERLDKIKRKVAEASRPQPHVNPAPADPARAAESVLGFVRDLEGELVRAREREEALRADLDDARRELGRAAGEGRTAVERLSVAEKELEQKRSVLGELLAEMQALEEERDESLRRAQALASLDEERARLLEELGRRAEEEARLRFDREAEIERLSEELRLQGTEGARLRAAVGELARERDQLGAELDRARHERDDLAEAKKALEAVHAALAQARARLG